jgi:UDP-glucose 4-epimerase
MKILITGVAGLIGSNLAKYLLEKKYEVIGIDDLSGGYEDFIPHGVKFYKINLLEENKLKDIFELEKPDYVYHLAAYAAEGLSPFIRNYNYSNNILTSVNLINNCINYNVKKIIFTSSMAVYGYGKPPFNESDLPSPVDPYGIAKYAVEQDLKTAYEHFDLNYTIIRPHNVIGINQNIWDKYRNVIGIWIRKIINNEPISIYGDGLQTRAFSDINFYMSPFEKVLFEHNDEIFNIGADKNYKIIDVAKILIKIAKKYGIDSSIQHYEPRKEVKHAFCEHDKAKKLLNFKDETDIEKTIENMFIWALKQPKRNVKYMNYEIQKNIYSYWEKNENK